LNPIVSEENVLNRKKRNPSMEPNPDLPPVHSKNQLKSLPAIQILAIIAAGAKLKVIRFAGIQIKEALGLYEIPMKNSLGKLG
jgi:hypothetical protein